MNLSITTRRIAPVALLLLAAACTTNQPPPIGQREAPVSGNYSQNVLERPVYTGQ